MSNVRPHEHSNNSFSMGSHRFCAFEHRLGRCSLVRIASGWISSYPEILDRNHFRWRRWRRLRGLRIPALGYRRGLRCSSESECSALRLLHTGINLSPPSGSSSDQNLRWFLWHHPICRCPVVWQTAGVWAVAHACGLTLPSRGCPKGCAFCAPLMSNVRRRQYTLLLEAQRASSVVRGMPSELSSRLSVGAHAVGRRQLVNANPFFTSSIARAVRPSAAREPPARRQTNQRTKHFPCWVDGRASCCT